MALITGFKIIDGSLDQSENHQEVQRLIDQPIRYQFETGPERCSALKNIRP